jgi:hypothetical protein
MITTHAIRRVTIPCGSITLYGDLSWPIATERVHALVVVVQPSSGSRLNPRNQALAAALNRVGHATLLTDLLSTDEDQWAASAARAHYDLALLTSRLRTVVERVARLEIEMAALPVAVLGTGTAALAALRAATELSGSRPGSGPAAARTPLPPRVGHIDAVVCRHGGTGGAAEAPQFTSGAVSTGTGVPALFLVAEHDRDAQEVQRRWRAARRGDLVEVPGARDLVDDAVAVEAVAQLAGQWITSRLDPRPAPRP